MKAEGTQLASYAVRHFTRESDPSALAKERKTVALWKYTLYLSLPYEMLSADHVETTLATDEACRLTSVVETIILRPLLSRILAQSGLHLLLMTTDIHTETKLFPQDLLQRASIPNVDPFALSRALLVVHAFALDCPVEALGSGQGRRQPDLLVRRLLVEYVGSVGREGDVENAGLSLCQLLDICIAAPSIEYLPSSRPPRLPCLPAPAPPSRGPSPGKRQRACGTPRR